MTDLLLRERAYSVTDLRAMSWDEIADTLHAFAETERHLRERQEAEIRNLRTRRGPSRH